MTLERLRKELAVLGHPDIEAGDWRGSLRLEGSVESWESYVKIGRLAAKVESRGLVNDLEVRGPEGTDLAHESLLDQPVHAEEGRELEGLSFDVAIVGGGVIGSAIARELSKWAISTVLLEKEEDVATHASGRNDGMIHDGFAAHPGSLKASYNVRGNRLWEPLAAELGIGFARPGSIILFHARAAAALYPVLAARAKENAVDGWELWSRKRVMAEEPNVTDEQHGAFFLPSAGILSPYKATVALAESAMANGVRVSLGTLVTGIETEDSLVRRVRTNRGSFSTKVLVNAAGIWADLVAGMANDRFFSLHPRRGVDIILDRESGRLQNRIMAMPSLLQGREVTKGGGLVRTIEDNILVGPTAREAPGREDYSTSQAELRELDRHFRLNRRLSPSMLITYFAGVRACTWEEDFIVAPSASVANLVHVAGIQSPGLASAPAIAEDAASFAIAALGKFMKVSPNPRFVPKRRPMPELSRLPLDERAAWIASDKAYARIVCRCEEVSEGEIRDAIVPRKAGPAPDAKAGAPPSAAHPSAALPAGAQRAWTEARLGATSLDAIKRRTRAGMGRCHGGFCTPRVMEIVSAELGIPLDEVTRKGAGSELVAGETKEGR
ncbi:MAG TPA: NAD(P)/FAD-dependent oxidoreductase [Rectinemataceae bacterium]|nr:NAD(P)/FAD-dependent oxidoreductase [Rectinemataceae bacterium]